MKHVLICSGKECSCGGKTNDNECPVCKWGVAICKVCGAAECEPLDIPDCPCHKNWREEKI